MIYHRGPHKRSFRGHEDHLEWYDAITDTKVKMEKDTWKQKKNGN